MKTPGTQGIVSEQESVWDYPRPPRLEPFAGRLEVVHHGAILADTQAGFRVLETSHPPVYYLPPADIDMSRLMCNGRRSFCEWKGFAEYFDLEGETDVAWRYPEPSGSFSDIAGYLAFYASRVEQCRVSGEVVQAQAGDFYGGWITVNIVGPFKGGPGTLGW